MPSRRSRAMRSELRALGIWRRYSEVISDMDRLLGVLSGSEDKGEVRARSFRCRRDAGMGLSNVQVERSKVPISLARSVPGIN